MKNVLLIVDPQVDFITGTLAVSHAEEKMNKLIDWIIANKPEQVFVTMDSHPENHCSFAVNGGQWPVHCVENTPGWEVYRPLRILGPMEHFMKGRNANKEEYSIFQNNDHGDELYNELLELQGSEEGVNIYVAGIAGDYCVMNTLQDLETLGFKDNIIVIKDCVASIDEEVFTNFINSWKTI